MPSEMSTHRIRRWDSHVPKSTALKLHFYLFLGTDLDERLSLLPDNYRYSLLRVLIKLLNSPFESRTLEPTFP